jgi:hypothetical protein
MTDLLKTLSPDLVEAMVAVKEKQARRADLTIYTGGTAPTSTQDVIDSVVFGRPTWRTLEQVEADERAARIKARRAANEIVPCPEPDLPSLEEQREMGEPV